jgi:isoquinoline 1-oxidoreductase subunit beta
MGLGVGLLNEISFKEGRVQQSNFDDFQMMRITDAPRETHVYIVPRGYDMHMGGVGEPEVPTLYFRFTLSFRALSMSPGN